MLAKIEDKIEDKGVSGSGYILNIKSLSK